MSLEDLKRQVEEGLEETRETFGEEDVEKAIETARDKAAEVISDLGDKFQK